MGFQPSTHAEDSEWNKGKKIKLLGKLRLQFEQAGKIGKMETIYNSVTV